MRKINPSMIIDDGYIHRIMIYGVGNCDEYSALVCNYLSKTLKPPVFYRFNLASNETERAGHQLVVINQALDSEGLLPKKISMWSDEAVIIDPWAGICAKAIHFIEAWKMQMDVMSASGVEFKRFVSSRKVWEKANSPVWYNCFDDNEDYYFKVKVTNFP